MVKALYPGSFDPPTGGHLDLIKRAAGLFDELVVAVGYNPDKSGWLDVSQRVALLEQLARDCEQCGNVSVTSFSGLVVDCAREVGATVLVKGLRNEADFAAEWTQATVNRDLGGIETLWLPSLPQWQHVSSSIVRELVLFGAPVDQYVPPVVAAIIAEPGDAGRSG